MSIILKNANTYLITEEQLYLARLIFSNVFLAGRHIDIEREVIRTFPAFLCRLGL